VLTRIEPGSDRYRRVSALMLRCVGWTVVPAVVLISIVADRVVRWLYGAQWVAAVPLVPWALAAVGLSAMTQTAYSLLLAYQEQRRCAIADALRLVGICAGLVLLLPFGLRAYLAGVALTQMITLLLCAGWLYRLKAVEGRGLLDALLPPAVSSAIALLGAEAVAHGFGSPRDVAWMALAYIAVFSLVYVATLRVVFRAQLDDVLVYLPHSGPVMRALRLREAA
jgi:O-antigen/teichoic acid export membrane protein